MRKQSDLLAYIRYVIDRSGGAIDGEELRRIVIDEMSHEHREESIELHASRLISRAISYTPGADGLRYGKRHKDPVTGTETIVRMAGAHTLPQARSVVRRSVVSGMRKVREARRDCAHFLSEGLDTRSELAALDEPPIEKPVLELVSRRSKGRSA